MSSQQPPDQPSLQEVMQRWGNARQVFRKALLHPPPLPKLRSHDCQQKQEAGAARDYKPGGGSCSFAKTLVTTLMSR